MRKKVLITGANGFIGYHLVLAALEADLDVYAMVRPGRDTSHLSALNINFLYFDFESIGNVITTLNEQKYNYIIHAAGSTKAKNQEGYNRVNADYTKTLAMAVKALNYKIEKFIFISSLAAVGPLDQLNTSITESMEARPVTGYGKSKLLAEEYLKTINDLPYLIIRPTAVYGPRERDIFIVAKSIKKGLEPYIGKFEQQLSFVYVKDLTELIIKALTSEINAEAYNISDGNRYDRYALGDKIKSALNKKAIKIHFPISVIGTLASLLDKIYANKEATPALNKEKMNELTAVNWTCSIEKARKDLGYVPTYNLERGIKESMDWYEQNKWF